MFHHNARNTGSDTRESPVLQALSFSNSPTIWRWQSGLSGSQIYRYQLDGVDVTGDNAATSYTLSATQPEGFYLFSVQECRIRNPDGSCGQWSNPASVSTLVDRTAPMTSFLLTEDLNGNVTVSLSCEDRLGDGRPGSGCEQTLYSLDGGVDTKYTDPITLTPQSQFEYYSIDRAENTEERQRITGDDVTLLNLEVQPPSIRPREAFELRGSLDQASDLQGVSGLPIHLIYQEPNPGTGLPGESCPDICWQGDEACPYDCHLVEGGQITDGDGRFSFSFADNNAFGADGIYRLEARFAGSALLGPSSNVRTLLVGDSAGYVVMVQGKFGDIISDRKSHEKTANRIYQTLLDRGFRAEDIRYFGYDATTAEAEPTKATIETVLTEWLPVQLQGVAAPVYFIGVDHGLDGVFYFDDNEQLSPTELDHWLDDLEAQINSSPNLGDIDRIVILGACYSGSFIPALSGKNGLADGFNGSNRVIITSATDQEESFKGPQEADNIRSGEFFLEELFQALGQSESLRNSFVTATAKTELSTRRDDSGNAQAEVKGAHTNSDVYLDDSVQHPLLDDNNDGSGSNVLTIGGDGDSDVLDQALGFGLPLLTNAPGQPAAVIEVNKNIYLAPSLDQVSTRLWARLNNDNRAIAPWLEIRRPTDTLNPSGTSTLQLTQTLERRFLSVNNHRWETGVNNFFFDPGRYETFVFVRDKLTDEISPAQRSVVYKNCEANRPPTMPKLLLPEDNASDIEPPAAIFDWTDAGDPDWSGNSDSCYPSEPPNRRLTYNLILSEDATEVLRLENLTTSATFVHNNTDTCPLTTLENGSCLKFDTEYCWYVEAVDAYGERATSKTHCFDTKPDTNPIPPMIFKGTVYSITSGARLANARISLLDGSGANITGAAGYYSLTLPLLSGDQVGNKARLTVEATGFRSFSFEETIVPNKVIDANVGLIPIAGTSPLIFEDGFE